MKINTVIALLGLTWIGSSQAGQYAVGSFAEIRCNQNGAVYRREVTAIDSSTGEATATNTTPEGVMVVKVQKSEFDNYNAYAANLSTNCPQTGGFLDVVTVPAGTFTSCNTRPDNDELVMSLADVPFLLVKVEASGVKCELNSYKW